MVARESRLTEVSQPGAGAHAPLQLPLNRSLIDNRPDFLNFVFAKLIEDIFGERHPSTLHGKPEKRTDRRTVKMQSACNVRRLANEELNLEA
jgi:hypothetical protein